MFLFVRAEIIGPHRSESHNLSFLVKPLERLPGSDLPSSQPPHSLLTCNAEAVCTRIVTTGLKSGKQWRVSLLGVFGFP